VDWDWESTTQREEKTMTKQWEDWWVVVIILFGPAVLLITDAIYHIFHALTGFGHA